ncbi:MAG: hypothetical protein OXE78_13545, partial [Gammaproteobacteria bacterium]|nr:hypothetical protein [Gammaproteobacteria bacterium]
LASTRFHEAHGKPPVHGQLKSTSQFGSVNCRDSGLIIAEYFGIHPPVTAQADRHVQEINQSLTYCRNWLCSMLWS